MINCDESKYWSIMDSGVEGVDHISKDSENVHLQRCLSYNCRNPRSYLDYDPNQCDNCWHDQHITDPNGWIADIAYSEEAVKMREKPESFHLMKNEIGEKDNWVCKLNCRKGAWGNYDSTYRPVKDIDLLAQHCTSDNCKDWNYEKKLDIEIGYDKCTKCWEWKDMNDWDNWDAKNSYAKELLKVIDSE